MARQEIELLDKILAAEDSQLEVLRDIRHGLHAILRVLDPPQAVSATLAVQGDSAMSTATLEFTDADGNATVPPQGDGSGLAISFSSDNSDITFGPVALTGDVATAPITGSGTFTFGATVANTSGAALLDDDGVTPFIQPASISATVAPPPPAQATSGVLSVD